jgi:methylisocitrate lyase
MVELYATLARDGSQVAMLDRMQTRSELYEAIGYAEYESLDGSIARSIVPPDIRNK